MNSVPRKPAVVQVSTKRPIDKDLINIALANVGSTQQNVALKTATFPCTITGIRWDLNIFKDGGTGHCRGFWAIVRVEDGLAANTISLTNGASAYQPEQQVLAFGTYGFADSTDVYVKDQGNTKTMRKLMGGDSIRFIMLGIGTAGTVTVGGTIQFFCKS